MTTAQLERTLEALLFLSPDPVDADALADATGAELHEVVTALERLREHYEFERRGLVLRELAGGWALSDAPRRRARRAPAAGPAADAAADARAGRDARDRRLPAAGLAARDRPDPRRQRRVGRVDAARARADRGGRPLAVRRRPVPDDRAVPEAVRAAARSTSCRTIDAFDPSPELEAELRERLLRAGEARAGRDRAAE